MRIYHHTDDKFCSFAYERIMNFQYVLGSAIEELPEDIGMEEMKSLSLVVTVLKDERCVISFPVVTDEYYKAMFVWRYKGVVWAHGSVTNDWSHFNITDYSVRPTCRYVINPDLRPRQVELLETD